MLVRRGRSAAKIQMLKLKSQSRAWLKEDVIVNAQSVKPLKSIFKNTLARLNVTKSLLL